ncbi:MAG: hypothetical protein ACLQOQ_15735 [Beijerinckiaceae bacterium]
MVTTLFLARLLGLFTIILAVAIVLNRAGIVAAIERMRRDSATLLIIELIGLAVGLAMVLSHNVWYGGVLPIVVTLVGWFIFLRAVVLLLLPPETIEKIFELAAWPKRANIYGLVSFVIGLFLTIMGFAG